MGSHQNGALGERLPSIASGVVAIPPSKSHVLRALMIAAGARRPVTLSYGEGRGWDEAGEDIRAGFECARALGSEVAVEGPNCIIRPGEGDGQGGLLEVGESGFLGRVAPTCAALSRSGRWGVSARGSLESRSSPALWQSLRNAGVEVIEGEGWLDSVQGPPELGPLQLEGPSSSQELSALWIGLAARGGGEVRLRGSVPSEPYLRLTRGVLEGFGFQVDEALGSSRVSVSAGAPTDLISAEADASAAAVALAAGCLANVSLETPCPAPGSLQGDWRIVEHLRAFGCQITERSGRLITSGPPTHGAELDLSGEPDLAPVLVAVAAAAALRGGGRSTLSGLQTLDGKESKRGVVLAAGLSAAGLNCTWSDPVLRVESETGESTEVSLDAQGDHRMAFAFALLGVTLPGVSVMGADCIAKSWPGFWSSMPFKTS